MPAYISVPLCVYMYKHTSMWICLCEVFCILLLSPSSTLPRKYLSVYIKLAAYLCLNTVFLNIHLSFALQRLLRCLASQRTWIWHTSCAWAYINIIAMSLLLFPLVSAQLKTVLSFSFFLPSPAMCICLYKKNCAYMRIRAVRIAYFGIVSMYIWDRFQFTCRVLLLLHEEWWHQWPIEIYK